MESTTQAGRYGIVHRMVMNGENKFVEYARCSVEHPKIQDASYTFSIIDFGVNAGEYYTFVFDLKRENDSFLTITVVIRHLVSKDNYTISCKFYGESIPQVLNNHSCYEASIPFETFQSIINIVRKITNPEEPLDGYVLLSSFTFLNHQGISLWATRLLEIVRQNHHGEPVLDNYQVVDDEFGPSVRTRKDK